MAAGLRVGPVVLHPRDSRPCSRHDAMGQLAECSVARPLRPMRDGWLGERGCVGPTGAMQLASRHGCERALGELDLRGAVALAQYQARNRLAVVRVGRLPAKRIGQARRWFNLDVLVSQVEEL